MLKKTSILNQLRILIGVAFGAIAIVAIQGCYDLNIALQVIKRNYEMPVQTQEELVKISNQLSQTTLLVEQISRLEKYLQISEISSKQEIYPLILKSTLEQIDKKTESIANLWNNYSKNVNSAEEKNIAESFSQIFTENLREQLQALTTNNQRTAQEKIEQILLNNIGTTNTLQKLLGELNTAYINKSKIQSDQYESLSSLYTNLLISCVVFLATLLLVLVWLSRHINHTIHKYLGSSPESLLKYVNEICTKHTGNESLVSKNSLLNIKTAINSFQENIARLLVETQQIQYAVSIGDTSVRGNTKHHTNEYRKTLETFNKILDQVVIIHGQDQRSAITEIMHVPEKIERNEQLIIENNKNSSTDLSVINQSSDDISRYAEEALIASMQLAQMNTSQLTALQYAANHMQFLADSIEQNRNSTQKAHQLTLDIMVSAQNEERELQAIAAAIDSINKNTQKIQSQISIIDSIALQGDILAFNVAIEAARFGDEGRGFSVIATEVRNLSQRAISSTQTLKDLISDTFFMTDDGNQRVTQAENTNRVLINQSHAIELTTQSMRDSADLNINTINEINQANITIDGNGLQQTMLGEYNRLNSVRLNKSTSALNAIIHPLQNSEQDINTESLILEKDVSLDKNNIEFDTSKKISKVSNLADMKDPLLSGIDSSTSELNSSIAASSTNTPEVSQTERKRIAENDWVLF